MRGKIIRSKLKYVKKNELFSENYPSDHKQIVFVHHSTKKLHLGIGVKCFLTQWEVCILWTRCPHSQIQHAQFALWVGSEKLHMVCGK